MDAQTQAPTRPALRDSVRARMRAAALPLLAALGPGLSIARIRAEARIHHPHGGYPTVAALLADALSEHLHRLNHAVAAAEARTAALRPEARLEQLILAWSDTAAAAPDAHRVFLLCAHAVPPDTQQTLETYRRLAIERMEAALAAAVPALAARPEAALALYPLIRLLLSDPHAWPAPPDAEQRQSAARRLAGMLIAAAEAEATGHWPRLGAATGPAQNEPPPTLTAHQARANWSALLHDVGLGREFLITRHGHPAARLVRAEGTRQRIRHRDRRPRS
jgi:hypothetical protein